jgi:hypothetical protein
MPLKGRAGALKAPALPSGCIAPSGSVAQGPVIVMYGFVKPAKVSVYVKLSSVRVPGMEFGRPVRVWAGLC